MCCPACPASTRYRNSGSCSVADNRKLNRGVEVVIDDGVVFGRKCEQVECRS